MKKEFFYPSKDELTQIHTIEWIPEGEVRGVLQIAHGMIEFIDRYDQFAQFMADNGFYVVGNDPVGEFGKAPRMLVETYRKTGIQDVTLKLYPGDRHEILNELDKDVVDQDLLEWIEARMS